MYEIRLRNGDVIESINRKLQETENQAAILTFTLLNNSIYYNDLEEFVTLIDVWKDEERVFTGRVIDNKRSMDSSGNFTCEVTCESAMNFLNDTRVGKWDIHPDLYVPEATSEEDIDPYNVYITMTVTDLLQLILDNHNAKVNDDKKIFLGIVTVDDNVYCKTDRETSLNCIQENLINKKGGYLEVQISSGIYYLNYYSTPPITEENLIEVTINMNSITKQGTLKNIYTRLTPLGKDGLKISGVNGGLDYVEDLTLKEKYGVIETVEKFNDVTIASNLKTKAIAKLQEININKYAIDCAALNLSCLNGYDFSEFILSQPCKILNGVIPINEVHRIIQINRNLDAEWDVNLKFSSEPPSSVRKEIKKEQEIKNLNNSVNALNNAMVYKTNKTSVTNIVQENSTLVEESITNGNILINGIETNVYTHPTESVKHTDIGGIAIKLVNKTGVASVKGSVVSASSTLDNSFKLQASEYDSIGIVLESGIADGQEAWVVISGVAEVLLEDNTLAVHGNWTTCAVTDGRANASAIAPSGGTIANIDNHFKEIGHCLENKSAGTNILAKCIIHFN